MPIIYKPLKVSRYNMNKNLIAISSIEISALAGKVWQVLTRPDKIKLYLFGTEVITDWKAGSPINFQGEFNGQQYKDKGNVQEVKINKALKYEYWSGFSGLEDKPENYSTVCYQIEEISEAQVIFTWKQQGFASEEGKKHTEQGLRAILKQIKDLAEEL
jgi:uncharacterized protein YndB with AHSA1/START domain